MTTISNSELPHNRTLEKFLATLETCADTMIVGRSCTMLLFGAATSMSMPSAILVVHCMPVQK